MRGLILLLLLVCCNIMYAQTITVSGTVTDVLSGEPIPGVAIINDTTQKGTETDFDGNYTIVATKGDVLEFTSIGYVTKTIKVENATINVSLDENLEELEEVVVIGYGKQKLTKVSGSLARVTSEVIEKQNSVRVEEALQSTAAGVSVISNGSPGASPAVIIRGVSSNAGAEPLVVINGIFQSIDDLNTLNPNDVESINVLKDAALTAMYGVRGANGVILVTTKKGVFGATKFTYDTSYAIQQVAKTVDVLNATEYGAILNEASVNAGNDLIFEDLSVLGEGTNWQNEVFQLAPITTHNISASGANENVSYYFSGGYLSQDGIVGGHDKSNFRRMSFTNNLTVDLTDKLKFITFNNYSNIKLSSISENSVVGVLSNALNFDPTLSVYDDNGDFSTSDLILQEVINPVAQIDNTYNEEFTNKLIGKFELQYDILNNLKFTNRLGYSYADIKKREFLPLVYYGALHNQTNANEDLSPIITVDPATGEETATSNRLINTTSIYFKYNFESFVNYNFTIADEHNFDTTLGFGITGFKSDISNVFGNNIQYNSWENADIRLTPNTNEDRNASADGIDLTRNTSFFGRVNYDYKDTFLISFLGRYDGSTNFGANKKYAFFPGASLGYVVSNEDYFNSSLINYLKFRGSYGVVGYDGTQNALSTIDTFPTYTSGDALLNGSALGSIPNLDRSWERQTQFNAGFDAKLFENTINISADYYSKNTNDLLFVAPLSLYIGNISPPEANVGSSKASGIDLSLGFDKQVNDDFKINTSINFTTVNALVTEVNNGSGRELGAEYGIPVQTITVFEEGETPWYFWGYQTDGVFQNQAEIEALNVDANGDGDFNDVAEGDIEYQSGANPGDIKYVDVNGDGQINDEDRTKIGDPFPDFTVGWNLAMDYKNFDFSVFTFASVGNDIYRAYERNSLYTNKFSSVLDRWTGEGTSDFEPRVTESDTNNNTRASDRYVEDGSYVRVKNIQLGYSIPDEAIRNTVFENVRVYAQVKNAFTFTKYSGFDPEIGSSTISEIGVDRGVYPTPRIWALGVNIKF